MGKFGHTYHEEGGAKFKMFRALTLKLGLLVQILNSVNKLGELETNIAELLDPIS